MARGEPVNLCKFCGDKVVNPCIDGGNYCGRYRKMARDVRKQFKLMKHGYIYRTTCT